MINQTKRYDPKTTQLAQVPIVLAYITDQGQKSGNIVFQDQGQIRKYCISADS